MIPEFKEPYFVADSDPDTIHKEMLKELPKDINIMPGDFAWDFTRPTALEKSRLIQFQLVQTLKMMFPMWAWEEWLDYHAWAAGTERKSAGHASGMITLEGLAGTKIEAGTKLKFATPATDTTPSIEFQFHTLKTLEIEDKEIEIPIVAVEAGKNSNVAAGTITLMSKPIKGITKVYNKEDVTGGTEIESDDSLRERIQEINESSDLSFIGNNSDYRRWAREVDKVGNVKVITNPDEKLVVRLVVWDENGDPAQPDLIKAVETHILSPDHPLDRKAPIGAILDVDAPSIVEIGYYAEIVHTHGFEMDDVKTAFQKNLLKHYAAASEDGVLKYSRICSILSNTEGVSDYFNLIIRKKNKDGVMIEITNNLLIEQDEFLKTVVADLDFVNAKGETK